jgi:hypothetical protein
MDSPADEIETFLRPSEYDLLFSAWRGATVFDSARRGAKALEDALIKEVRRREAPVKKKHKRRGLPQLDLAAFTRGKLGPMVRGLFPKVEQEPVLALLERSLVFLMPENIETVLRILGESIESRNGWRAILERCSE